MERQPRTISEEARWRQYEEQLKAHTEAREKVRPKREDFVNEHEYEKAHSTWVWESCVDAPNRPDQEYANNH